MSQVGVLPRRRLAHASARPQHCHSRGAWRGCICSHLPRMHLLASGALPAAIAATAASPRAFSSDTTGEDQRGRGIGEEGKVEEATRRRGGNRGRDGPLVLMTRHQPHEQKLDQAEHDRLQPCTPSATPHCMSAPCVYAHARYALWPPHLPHLTASPFMCACRVDCMHAFIGEHLHACTQMGHAMRVQETQTRPVSMFFHVRVFVCALAYTIAY